MIDVSTALAFSLFENKGVYALIIGSGVSRAAQIPTGWEITLDLVRRLAALEGIKDQADWAFWHRERFGTEPSYSNILDQLAQTADERRSILHSYIEPSTDDIAQGRKIPTKAHHAIARMAQAGYVRVIVTTNFDRLLENALREAGVEPTVIKSDDDLKGAIPLIHSRCVILKVHGDYLDTRIRNTEGELATYSGDLDRLLDRIFDEHGLIVCGWSADWDPALKAAITRAPNRRYPFFWAARGKLSAAAAELVAYRSGRTIPIENAEAFFGNLERLISVQEELQRPNPRSVELIVASTKKYLSKPEFRIQLADLVGDESRQLSATAQNAQFKPQNYPSKEGLVKLIGQYEAITEPLARVFGVLGRWGLEPEFDIAFDTISRFGAKGGGGGYTDILALET
jgi:SIR2-like domain